MMWRSRLDFLLERSQGRVRHFSEARFWPTDSTGNETSVLTDAERLLLSEWLLRLTEHGN